MKDDGDREGVKQVVDLSRRIVRSIWKKALEGAPLGDKERRIAEILRLHGQYAEAWEGRESAAEAGGNRSLPFLHLHAHLMVERQINEGKPPGVKRAAEQLEEMGVGRHEVIHLIGEILLEGINRSLSEGREFSAADYSSELEKLVRKEGRQRR